MVYAFAVVCVVLAVVAFAAVAFAWASMIWMPGKSCHSAAFPLDEQEVQVRDALEHDLNILANQIGERNIAQRYEQLIEAAKFIERSLQEVGYDTRRQEITVHGKTVWNVDVECTGCLHPQEVIVIGAHYDTVPGSPGANDNGSAVVANLALARVFAGVALERTVRFAFFVNEESPYYMTDAMGSLRYAKACREDAENLLGMISLETIGYYREEPRTQHYPSALLRHLYPTTGNFVAVVGNVRSRSLVHQVIRGLRKVPFPSEGMAAPRWLKDIFRSDHAAFWHCGYPALMITDTANFRYPHYHTPQDTVDKIDFVALAHVVSGLRESLRQLAGESTENGKRRTEDGGWRMEDEG